MLHSSHDCQNRNYKKGCAMRVCKYRVEAIVLKAAEPEESPENVVQQTNGAEPTEISADIMEEHMRGCF
jgi:hypothetical protein